MPRRIHIYQNILYGQAASSLYCPHCFNLIRPGNHSARLAPKLRLSRRIANSKRKATARGLLSLTKQKASQLKRWEQSQTKLSIKCQACNATAKIPGSKRHRSQPKQEGRRKLAAKRRLHQQETQQAGGQDTRTSVTPRKFAFPFTTPTAQGHRASPGVTPAGTLSASARKARNLNKQKHQQLQRMLAGAKQEKANTQSPLKDFLVSL
ncbi:UPF0711 protein C18orf21 homolog isoform X2 [Patiria miniata]|uniref:Uncharacterized protein n=1 Tax=Patiria miniata TaxID=46514 RepID=A0A914AUV5_PATMI|nr:UPF0711 protein C18orf21 homolog isoform X2 [Patiria miniata]